MYNFIKNIKHINNYLKVKKNYSIKNIKKTRKLIKKCKI